MPTKIYVFNFVKGLINSMNYYIFMKIVSKQSYGKMITMQY